MKLRTGGGCPLRLFLTDDGNWLQLLGPARGEAVRPALFLDRDGVVVEETNYLCRAEDVAIIAGAAATIARANAAGWFVAIVANQSGIGRGYYDWTAFAAVQERLLGEIHAAGARIDLVAACPFHPEARPPYRHADHPWRKPRPGMLLEAARRLPIDLQRSWIVGDRASDMAAGRAAGLAGGLHVRSGHGGANRAMALAEAGDAFTVRCGETVAAMAGILAELAAAGAEPDTPDG